jgi:uncharacterized tellurite resistance protein B-like protein
MLIQFPDIINMLNSLKDFFKNNLVNDAALDNEPARSVELAAAVLMVEISLADASFDSDERRLITRVLQQEFKLSAVDAQAILSLAEQESDHAVSLHEFTRLINDSMSAGDKVRIIQLLWQVAFADSVLDKYEEYYLRKIADLLYISHADYIRAKHNSR